MPSKSTTSVPSKSRNPLFFFAYYINCLASFLRTSPLNCGKTDDLTWTSTSAVYAATSTTQQKVILHPELLQEPPSRIYPLAGYAPYAGHRKTPSRRSRVHSVPSRSSCHGRYSLSRNPFYFSQTHQLIPGLSSSSSIRCVGFRYLVF